MSYLRVWHSYTVQTHISYVVICYRLSAHMNNNKDTTNVVKKGSVPNMNSNEPSSDHSKCTNRERKKERKKKRKKE